MTQFSVRSGMAKLRSPTLSTDMSLFYYITGLIPQSSKLEAHVTFENPGRCYTLSECANLCAREPVVGGLRGDQYWSVYVAAPVM
jgi:hypothetical protein